MSAWMANNSEPHYRRASSVAFGFIATNAVSAARFILLYITEPMAVGWYSEHVEFPFEGSTPLHEDDNYEPDFVSVQVFSPSSNYSHLLFSSAIVVVLSVANMLILDRKNKQKTQKRADVLAPYGDDAQSNEKAWKELGDQHPDFRYTL